MRTIGYVLALAAVVLVMGCVPEQPATLQSSERPGTPDDWPSVTKGTRTPLLRRIAPEPRMVPPREDIEVIEELPPPVEVVTPEPRPAATPAPRSLNEALKGLTQVYVVQKGDMLSTVAKRYSVTANLLQRINGLPNENVIHIGQRLKVVRGPFNIGVDTKSLRLNIYLGQKHITSYPVGLGTDDNACPMGRLRILDKVVNPRWDYGGMHAEPGDPNNPVGTRWIKIATSFGIHGTNDPASISKRSSAGCIRMHNRDVEEVFDMVRVGGQVTVQ